MKLILHPSDQNFKANVAELHDASGASEPTEYHIAFRGDAQRPAASRTRAKITTRRIRLSTDDLHALSADGLHEIVLPLAEVGEITVVWLPKQLLCIIAPNRSNSTASCAILGIHPTHESAEWEALDYLSERGFKAQNFAELLQAVRNSQQYDIVREEI
ncbi:hypothetical protein BURC_04895 [Burkholderiaceae bacterium]|nr:hypothetical protein BURC_04895 [Burkholderiaceae bacterium]